MSQKCLPLYVAGTLMTPESDVLVLSRRNCDPAALHGRQTDQCDWPRDWMRRDYSWLFWVMWMGGSNCTLLRGREGAGEPSKAVDRQPRKTWTPGYLLWRWRKGPQSEGAGSLCDEKSKSLHNPRFSSEARFGLLAPRSIENKYMHSEAVEAGVTCF